MRRYVHTVSSCGMKLSIVSQGTPVGQIIDGDPKKLAGKKVDKEGKIWDNAGKVIGHAEPLQEVENDDEADTSAPFEDFPESVVDAKGNVLFEGRVVGKLSEGDGKKLEGKKVLTMLLTIIADANAMKG
jgi:hypothetical protein